ncbi:hypothetical protein F5Y10DRAFT_95250 [Nemania abortiva]|nr:hypothetical protein F5Y10DRAFT_95250 [Nemania abortiva]
MSLADAAWRLLRTLSLSPSTTVMVDLQRDDGRGGPAVGGLWWCADSGAGTDTDTDSSSTSTFTSSLELELWPSPSSISRRPSSSSSSSSSLFSSTSTPSADHPDGQHGGRDWESGARLRIGASADTPKTIPWRPAPHIRRADSFDSVASSVSSSASSLGGSSVDGDAVVIPNTRSARTSIGVWGAESASGRRQPAGSGTKRRAKKRSSSSSGPSDVLWRGYWD